MKAILKANNPLKMINLKKMMLFQDQVIILEKEEDRVPQLKKSILSILRKLKKNTLPKKLILHIQVITTNQISTLNLRMTGLQRIIIIVIIKSTTIIQIKMEKMSKINKMDKDVKMANVHA